MTTEEEFDSAKFEKVLMGLKDSQDSINKMSNWCLQRSQRVHHKKIVATWLTVLKQVKVESRLTLFYLANDVIQYSKRKNYDFVDSWGTALQRATTMVRDEKVKQKIARIFRIWEERSIYNEDFLADLNGLLNTAVPVKAKPKEGAVVQVEATTSKEHSSVPAVEIDDFQPSQLVTSIQSCVKLQEKTDRNFKLLPKTPDCDVEKIKHAGKDRAHVEGVDKEINESALRLESYINSLKAEIKVRHILIAALGQAGEFYKTQRGDVKTVAIAYRNFGNRIKTMKKKLDEIGPTLPSPIPSPDINAPSPPPDNDLELPGETSFSNGFTSFLNSSQLPFDISDFQSDLSSSSINNRIQVIESMGGEADDGPQTSPFKPVYKLPPQPVPPVAANYGQSMTNFTRPSSYSASASYSAVPPLLPPPMPPSLAQNNCEEYDPEWNNVAGWNPQRDETPSSPPFFETKGVDTNAVEYNECSDGMVNPGNDVDQRNISAVLGKNASHLLDVDHRNLISLTGSPGQKSDDKMAASKPDLPDQSQGWSSTGDTDFRSNPSTNASAPLMPPPIFGMHSSALSPPPQPRLPPNFFGDSRNDYSDNFSQNNYGGPMTRMSPAKGKSNGQRDNLESVDMEMSDDEQDEMNSSNEHMDNNSNDMDNMSNQMSFMNYPPPPPVPPNMGMDPWSDNSMEGNNNGYNNNNAGVWNQMGNNMGPPPRGRGGGFFHGNNGPPPHRGPPPFGHGPPPNFRNGPRGRGGRGMPMHNGNFRPRGPHPFMRGKNFRGNMRGGPPMW